MSPYLPALSLTHRDLALPERRHLLLLFDRPAYPVSAGWRRRGDRFPLTDRVLARLVGMRLAQLAEPPEEPFAGRRLELSQLGETFAHALRKHR